MGEDYTASVCKGEGTKDGSTVYGHDRAQAVGHVISYDVRPAARIARLMPIFHSLFANRECRMTRIGSTFVPLQRVYAYTMIIPV